MATSNKSKKNEKKFSNVVPHFLSFYTLNLHGSVAWSKPRIRAIEPEKIVGIKMALEKFEISIQQILDIGTVIQEKLHACIDHQWRPKTTSKRHCSH